MRYITIFLSFEWNSNTRTLLQYWIEIKETTICATFYYKYNLDRVKYQQ